MQKRRYIKINPGGGRGGVKIEGERQSGYERTGARVTARRQYRARKDLLPDPSTKLFESWHSDGTPGNHARTGRSLRKILIIFLEILQISTGKIFPRRCERSSVLRVSNGCENLRRGSRVRRLLPRVAKLDHNQEKADYPLWTDSVKLAVQYDHLIQISRKTREIMSFRGFTRVLLSFKISSSGRRFEKLFVVLAQHY